jgi:hypothetical protein
MVFTGRWENPVIPKIRIGYWLFAYLDIQSATLLCYLHDSCRYYCVVNFLIVSFQNFQDSSKNIQIEAFHVFKVSTDIVTNLSPVKVVWYVLSLF